MRSPVASILALTAGLGVTALAATASAASYSFPNTPTSAVSDTNVNLTAGVPVSFATKDPANVGLDTVLYVLDASRNVVAYNDDSGGLTSFVQFTPATTGAYRVIVHAYARYAGGVGDLWMNGAPFMTAQSFGGTAIHGLGSDAVSFRTALSPLGTNDTVLYAIRARMTCSVTGCSTNPNAAIDFDDDGGIFRSSRIDAVNVNFVVVGKYPSATSGPTNFYANDASNDADGDGLGKNLEAELGTCDSSTTSPNCNMVAANGSGAQYRDSDHDGLSDDIEVLGKADGARGQQLPQWGATPTHKDLFMQVDWSLSKFGSASNPVTPAIASSYAAYFTAGTQTELQNLQGGGIAVHLDVKGIAPDPTPAQVYGDWGGSQETNFGAGSYLSLLPAARRGLFRLMMIEAGGATDPGTAVIIGVDPVAGTMAHETGHSLQLSHWGNDAWGAVPCKPNYPSVMNYLYGNSAPGFSHGLVTQVLNPAAVDESNPFGSAPTFLDAMDPSNNHFAHSGNAVDWNRDGLFENGISGAPVRAPLTYGQQCGGADRAVHAPGDLLSANSAAVKPRLLHLGSRLVALWVDQRDGKLHYKTSALSGPDANGSCPLGGGIDAPCTTWDAADTIVPTSGTVAAFSAISYENNLVVAYRGGSRLGSSYPVDVIDLSPGGVWSSDQLVTFSNSDPELAVLGVDSARYGKGSVAALFTNNGTFNMTWSGSPSGAWSSGGALKTPSGGALVGVGGGSVTPWSSVSTFSPITACGVFPDSSKVLQLYCYDYHQDRWVFESATPYVGIGPNPTLTFHVLRDANGTPLENDAANGQFWLETAQGDGLPITVVSSRVTGASGPAAATGWTWLGYFINPYTGPNVTTYEDYTMSAMKGLVVAGTSLEFLPYADGTFKASLKDGNDFQVMERGLCWGLHLQTGDADSYCGTRNVFGY